MSGEQHGRQKAALLAGRRRRGKQNVWSSPEHYALHAEAPHNRPVTASAKRRLPLQGRHPWGRSTQTREAPILGPKQSPELPGAGPARRGLGARPPTAQPFWSACASPRRFQPAQARHITPKLTHTTRSHAGRKLREDAEHSKALRAAVRRASRDQGVWMDGGLGSVVLWRALARSSESAYTRLLRPTVVMSGASSNATSSDRIMSSVRPSAAACFKWLKNAR